MVRTTNYVHNGRRVRSAGSVRNRRANEVHMGRNRWKRTRIQSRRRPTQIRNIQLVGQSNRMSMPSRPAVQAETRRIGWQIKLQRAELQAGSLICRSQRWCHVAAGNNRSAGRGERRRLRPPGVAHQRPAGEDRTSNHVRAAERHVPPPCSSASCVTNHNKIETETLR